MTTIVSIQSTVAYGHVGNSAATFPLMRRGIEVWPVITVHFSNHTGYQQWRGPLLRPDDVRDVVTGMDERAVLGNVDGVLSGYQGAEEMGAAVLDAVRLIRERNPQARYCCDPVMGDVGRGFYVRPGIPEFMRDTVVPTADLVTPNQFELEFLTDRRCASTADVLAAARQLGERGPRTVLVTSVEVADNPVGSSTDRREVSMIAVDADGAYAVSTPRLEQAFTGSGDITAAIFFAELLGGAPIDQALGTTADVVYAVLRRTAESDSPELALVAAQDEIAQPSQHFTVRRLDG